MSLSDVTVQASTGPYGETLTDALTIRAIASLACGKSMPETAKACNVPLRSLERRVRDVKSATGAKTTIHLVVKYVRAGLI